MTDEVKALVEAATAVLAVIDNGQKPYNSAEDLRDALAAVNLAPELLASEAALRAERDAAALRAEKAERDCAAGGAYHEHRVAQYEAQIAHLSDPLVKAAIERAPTSFTLTGDAAETHRARAEADALRASLAAVTARAEKAEELLSRTCGPQALEDLRAQCKQAERERDHLQARCEAEGAARMRVEEALRNARPIVDAVASIGPADLFPETLAAARPACDAIDAALGKKPCPGFPLGDGNFSGCNAAETGATDCPICGIDAALETKP